MDRERGFSFKLLVPPRVNHGQVSAVRPQEVLPKCGDLMTPIQQGFTKCFDREKQHISNKSILAPTKPNRQDSVKMTLVSPMEKENSNTGQIYTKLFDEVEKIKCWKVKIDSDAVKMERKLHENKRTIETQRKAIQELQFGNESLSFKLEEQISENDELRNRNNATRDLCSILKDTFDRSVEKMHLFECEREETHDLLLEYQSNLQKQMEAFDALYFKSEANQEELLKAKDELMLFEDLKNKFQEEYHRKEEEIKDLQTKLKDNDKKLNNILLDLQETKAQCRTLQGEIDQKSDLLISSNTECASLVKNLQEAEARYSETEKAMVALVAKNEEAAGIIQSKDSNLQVLIKEKTQLTEKLGQMQMSVDELKKSLVAETEKTHLLEDRVTTNLAELEQAKNDLGEMKQESVKTEEQIHSLMEKLDLKNDSVEALNSRMAVISERADELTVELSKKNEEIQQLKNVCENAEKELEEFKALAQARVDELQTHLTNEKEKITEKTSEVFQLQGEIKQLKSSYENLLSNFNELQSAKSVLEQKLESRYIAAQTVEENIKMKEEKTQKLTDKMGKLENENDRLRCELDSIKSTLHNKCKEMEALRKNLEESEENMQNEISKKERKIRVFEAKNKTLKKQVAKEAVKTAELLDTINNLQGENQNLKQVHKVESQKLVEDQQNKTAAVRELENEVQKLRLEAKEATRCQEDAELKCQNKIADMVTLMDKHKNQYDLMVQEKDAELEANREKEMKAVAHGKSLKQELTKQKKENDSLKKELKEHLKEKENLQNELIDLKNEKERERESKQLPICDDKKEEVLKSPAESLLKLYRFDFSKARRTPSSTKDDWAATVGNTYTQASDSISGGATPKSMGIHSEKMKTPTSIASRSSSKIKTYRIRTPPSTEKKATWEKRSISLDPKSDSSGNGDFFMCANTSTPMSASRLFRKSQGSPNSKSPKNYIKIAAMKRMRDAGWTAVTGNEKKKKTNEKIFA